MVTSGGGNKGWQRAISVIAVCLGAPGCGSAEVPLDHGPESGDDGGSSDDGSAGGGQSYDFDDLELPPGFELAPNQIPMGAEPTESEEELSPEELAALAEADPTWRAADGTRYEALLVLADGTTYGRRGPAATAPVPDESNAYVPPPERVVEPGPEVDPEGIILNGGTFADRRTRVYSTSVLQSYPTCTIGAISNTTDPGGSVCTGTKIGPRAIISASHCFFTNEGVVKNFSARFHPGQTATSHPNGPSTSFVGLFLRDFRAGIRFDYAVVILQDTQASASLGWVNAAWWNSGTSYTGLQISLAGYPEPTNDCLASPETNQDCDGWMYKDVDTFDSAAYGAASNLFYDLDTDNGQSGSSILATVGTSQKVVGIHHGGDYATGYNYGARFRQTMWDDVCEWIGSTDSQFASHPACP